MARGGPQLEVLQLLLHQGGEHDDAAKQRLEQLWQEVAPQVRRDARVAIEDTRCSNTRGASRRGAWARPTRAIPLTIPTSRPPPSPRKILDGPAIENQLSMLNFLPTGALRRPRPPIPSPSLPAFSPDLTDPARLFLLTPPSARSQAATASTTSSAGVCARAR